MKIVVTGTRGIPAIMGGVETHCEELFPRVVALGYDVTVMRRSSYVADSLTEWHGVKLMDIPTPRKKAFEAIVHTVRAVIAARRLGADVVHIHAIGPGRIAQIHVKDGVNSIQGSVHLGRGETNFFDAARAIRDIGYDGWIVLENYYSRPCFHSELTDPWDRIARDVEIARKAFDIT